MYIWNLECVVMWSYHEDEEEAENDGSIEDYTLAALNFEEVVKKLNKIALAKSRGFVDDNDPDSSTFGKRLFPVKVVDILKLERKERIDG